MAERRTAAAEGTIHLRRIPQQTMVVEIRGVTPIIEHKFSQAAMAGLHGHPEATGIKEKRGLHKPEEEAEDCLHRLDDGRVGMPAVAFKAAMVRAAKGFEGMTMRDSKTMFFVEGEGDAQLVPVEGTLILRQDAPRLANGNPELRYRYMLTDWRATLRVRFKPSKIDADSIVALADEAGTCGVGDWRPNSPKSDTGTYGQWRVATEEAD